MSSPRRNVRRIFAVVICALVFCSVAAAASTDPQVQIVPADQAWADSIVLTSSDLGRGWTADPSIGGGTSSGGSGDGECASPDESDLTLTGGSSSPDFERSGGSFVSSTAMVWQTADQAQADWDRNVKPSLLDCLAAEVASASTKKFKIAVTGKREVVYPALAPRMAAYRISYAYKFRVKVKKKRKTVSVPATFDFVAFGNGRATAMLIMISLNKSPLGESYKQLLATRMTQRMATDPNPAPAP